MNESISMFVHISFDTNESFRKLSEIRALTDELERKLREFQIGVSTINLTEASDTTNASS